MVMTIYGEIGNDKAFAKVMAGSKFELDVRANHVRV